MAVYSACVYYCLKLGPGCSKDGQSVVQQTNSYPVVIVPIKLRTIHFITVSATGHMCDQTLKLNLGNHLRVSDEKAICLELVYLL